MIDKTFLTAILNSIDHPVLFVDTDHVIRFSNTAADKYYGKLGYSDLLDKSIFDWHNPDSSRIIRQVFQAFLDGEDECYLTTNDDGFRVYMRAVRDADGQLLGYYERYEAAAEYRSEPA
ncbi:PAS domain-containing protein [Candidatus Neomarinimicrobiota bacterium]